MVEISEDKGFNKTHFDESVKPADDFFEFTNGGWMKNNPIPPEYPSMNTFLDLHIKN
jgi:putative endopeptidase